MPVTLRRPPPRRMGLSVVSMIDVMMILLFFFMITSSYLNLDMIPALQKSEADPTAASQPAAPGAAQTILVRIAADGSLRIGGQGFDAAGLESHLRTRLAAEPMTQVLLFPSGAADLQALVSAMDAVTRAGASRVKVIRIEAAP